MRFGVYLLRLLILVVGLTSIIVGQAKRTSAPKVLSVCDLFASIQSFNNKIVTVRGEYHDDLFAPNCAHPMMVDGHEWQSALLVARSSHRDGEAGVDFSTDEASLHKLETTKGRLLKQLDYGEKKLVATITGIIHAREKYVIVNAMVTNGFGLRKSLPAEIVVKRVESTRVVSLRSPIRSPKMKLLADLCYFGIDRQKAIEGVVANPKPVLPWLLEWAKCPLRNPPSACEEGLPSVRFGMYVGCAFPALVEIFGRLQTKEAIPFLIENIWLDDGGRRTRTELDTGSPCIHALLEIGPDATPQLLQALRRWPANATDEFDRLRHLGIVITLAFMGDPRAKPALEEIAKERGVESKIARDSLRGWKDKK